MNELGSAYAERIAELEVKCRELQVEEVTLRGKLSAVRELAMKRDDRIRELEAHCGQQRDKIARMKARLHAAMVAEFDSDVYREAVSNYQALSSKVARIEAVERARDSFRDALISIVSVIGGRSDGVEVDQYAGWAAVVAHHALHGLELPKAPEKVKSL